MGGGRKSDFMDTRLMGDMLEWRPDDNLNNANIEMEELSDNDAFALNDKDDLFLSELGNILLEEEKFNRSVGRPERRGHSARYWQAVRGRKSR